MNFDDMSLEELIASQKKDMRTGHFAEVEGMSLDKVMSSGATMGEVWLSNSGFMNSRVDRRRGGGCTLHGYKYYMQSGRCRECQRAYRYDKRRAAGVPMRHKRPECGHGPEHQTEWGDKRNKACKECDRIRKREYYRQNREKILAQKKAKAAELRAKGLSTRKRPLKPKPVLPEGVKLIAWIEEDE